MQRRRLALVDDDESARRPMCRHLPESDKSSHKEVYIDAAAALKDISASPRHVVLIEVALPGLPRIGYTSWLKAAVPASPLLFYTARADWRMFRST